VPAPVLSPSPLRWDPPAAIRGTVVVLHGRGEHGGVYERFGRRLAADGYAVAGPDLPEGEDAALGSAATSGPPGAPFVLIGSDTGAVRAIELANVLDPRPDALVLAGLPLAGQLPGAPPDGPGAARGASLADVSWDDELAARTACPVHSAKLGSDPRVSRGALAEPVGPVPSELPDLPILVIHGAIDAVADLAAIRALTATSPKAYLAVVAGGRHDILNDAMHRSVAAHVVLFLEAVRAGERLVEVEPA
jgi:alpha-beta hydrolase superfamily lysophospholipase